MGNFKSKPQEQTLPRRNDPMDGVRSSLPKLPSPDRIQISATLATRRRPTGTPEPVRRQSSDLGTSVLAPDFSFRSTFPQRDTTPLPLTFELFEARERLEREDFNCDFSRVLNEARME